MKVFKRPNSPYWWAAFTDPRGRRHRFSTKRLTSVPKREAEAVAALRFREVMDAVQLGVKPECTVREALEHTLAMSDQNKDRKNMGYRVAKLLGDAVRPCWSLPKGLMLHEVTSATVQQIRRARIREGLSGGAINHELKLLRKAWRLAREGGYRVHPDEIVWTMSPVREKLRYLTPEEEARMLAELDPSRVGNRDVLAQHVIDGIHDSRDLAIFLLDTGARCGEAYSILWDAIDLDGGTVNIYRPKVGNEGTLRLTDRLLAVLKRRHARREGPYVFPGKDGAGHRTAHARSIARAMDRAGCNEPHLVERYGRATPHSLRDTFASRLVQAGVSLYKVQRLLGHTSPRMTQKYAHLEPNAAADEAAAVLNALAKPRLREVA